MPLFFKHIAILTDVRTGGSSTIKRVQAGRLFESAAVEQISVVRWSALRTRQQPDSAARRLGGAASGGETAIAAGRTRTFMARDKA